MQSKLLRLFADERIFWNFATVLLTTVAVLKGLRKPNTWSATQAQVSYAHGFVKRGLFGSVLSSPLHLEHYRRFTAVSFLLFGIMLVCLALFTWCSGIGKRCGSLFPVAVFGAGYGMTFLAHLNGYFDIPLCILTVTLLMIRSAQLRLWLGLPVVLAALLIHELFLFVFLPVVLLSFLLQALYGPYAQQRRTLIYGLLILLLACGVTVVMAAQASVSPATAQAIQKEVTARADFIVRPDYFAVLLRSVSDSAQGMRTFLHREDWQNAEVGGALALSPTALLLLSVMSQLIPKGGRRQVPAIAASVVAALAPLSMNLLAWDVGRWYALASLCCFLVLLTIARYAPGRHLDHASAFQRAAILAIALGMASGGLLMDHLTGRFYPFFTSSL